MKNIISRKKLISFLALTVFCIIIFPSCQDDELEYLPPEYLKITGVTSTTANSTKDYYTFYMDGVNYVWTAPPGATITEGQGTRHVKVLFGNTGGTLSVEAKGMTASIQITIL